MSRAVRRTAALALLLAVAAAPLGTAAAAGTGTLPAVRHVFVVNVENKSFDEAYVSNPNPYLPKTLRAEGQLLTQYHGIGHVSLPNYIAQLSGQAPNAATQSDCQQYVDFAPGVQVTDGQAVGQGCVFPASVKTLP